MARIHTKIGDIYEVNIGGNVKKYFQHVANDQTQLSSNVIRVFKESYSIKEFPDISKMVNGSIDFYTHCIIKVGIKLGFWKKIGNNPNIGNIKNILFRDTDDCGSKPGEQILISNNWYVWRVNEEFTSIGKLKEKFQDAEIGVVVTPEDILFRIQNGRYDFFYPR